MSFMYDEQLSMGYEKSNEILERLKLKRIDVNGFIHTNAIIDAVEDVVNCHVKVKECSFKSGIGTEYADYGAMMMTHIENGERVVEIVLNSDKEIEFQRFSLVHELGHLMTTQNPGDLFQNNEEYVLSTHINYEITDIPKEVYEHDEFLRGEQLANIFALRVLMPNKPFFEQLRQRKNLIEVSKVFGLSPTAVISRIMLVE